MMLIGMHRNDIGDADNGDDQWWQSQIKMLIVMLMMMLMMTQLRCSVFLLSDHPSQSFLRSWIGKKQSIFMKYLLSKSAITNYHYLCRSRSLPCLTDPFRSALKRLGLWSLAKGIPTKGVFVCNASTRLEIILRFLIFSWAHGHLAVDFFHFPWCWQEI